jgi:formate hydrogenlyase subunit 6/NADH:ubiquinone oxidoreductase subunit I
LRAAVDKERCIGCGLCKSVCPRRAIELIPIAETKNKEIEIHKNRLQVLERQIGIVEKGLDKVRKDILEIKK